MAAAYNGRIYIFGGKDSNLSLLSSVEILTPE